MHRSFILAYHEIHRAQAIAELGLDKNDMMDADVVAQHAESFVFSKIMDTMGAYKSHLSVSEMFRSFVRQIADE